jgi:hypothetical protein
VTIFGKVLLLLNVALSLLGLSWAVFVFSNPVLGQQKLEEYKAQAEFGRRTARDALTEQIRATEALRVAEMGKVKGQPAPGELRYLERDWYDAELAHLKYGDPEGTAPDKKHAGLQAIDLDDKGMKLDPAKGNRPLLVTLKDPENPARPIDKPLVAQVKAREDAFASLIGKQIDTLVTIIASDIELTKQLDGSAEEKRKGLKRQVEEEQKKAQLLLDQLQDLRPLYVNSAVESELILRRQADLRKRYEELLRQPAGENP